MKGDYNIKVALMGNGFQIWTASSSNHQKELSRVRTFELKNRAIHSTRGEFLLGFQETGSHACYMIYGVLKSKEKARPVKPGPGHEEIVLATKGDLEVTGFYSGSLKEGFALHLEGDQECFLENRGESEAIYIIAGGHSEAGRH
jgi:hypothetical protein